MDAADDLPDREVSSQRDGARFDVVVVGSLNLDLVVHAPRHPTPGETLVGTTYDEYPGGKGLNQAVAAARSGASVALVGAVGDDSAGEYLRAVVQEEGIDDLWVSTIPSATTGRALITVDDAGENSIIVVPGANAQLSEVSIPASRVVLAQLEIPVAAVTEAFLTASANGVTTILNPSPATTLPDELINACSVLVPNEHEIELLGGVGGMSWRIEHVVVTLGEAGAKHTTSGAVTTIDPVEVNAIDTTGAGDAFCGALAARLAHGDEIADALRFASAAGALATTTPGAVPSQPRREQTLAAMNG